MRRLFAALIALTFAACAESGSEPLARYDIEGTDGQRWSVALLSADGDAAARRYTLEVDDRVLELAMDVTRDTTLYTVEEAGRTLVTVETYDGRESTTMAPDGRLFLTFGVDRALMYGQIREAVDETALMATSEALVARLPAPGADPALGKLRQGLAIRMNNSGCCPVSCKATNPEDPNKPACCCNVGERCVPTNDTCWCESAKKPGASVYMY